MWVPCTSLSPAISRPRRIQQTPARPRMLHIFSILQCIAVCCSVLQCNAVCCTAVCCSALQWFAYGRIQQTPAGHRVCNMCHCCSMLQWVAVCCSVLQYVAVRCSVLQCVAVCCSGLPMATYNRRRHTQDLATDKATLNPQPSTLHATPRD